MPILIVFIDSLRYHAPLSVELERLGFSRTSFVPPLGFSANILPLMFRGKAPDELGFYNEFGVAEHPRSAWIRWLDPVVEQASRAPLARKILYAGLRRLGWDPANIPFRALPYFEKLAVSPYRDGTEHPSLLEEFDFSRVLASRIRARPPARDTTALAEALERVRAEPRLYVSLNDLDAISHASGLGSAEYRQHESTILESVRRLVERFRQSHGADAPVVVLSDHGMTEVDRTVRLDPERTLGKPAPSRYLYFLDSTLARFWANGSDMRESVENFLAGHSDAGRLVTAEERQRWGMENPAFGTHLFVAHEGVIFSPNFIGRGVPLAMHGYHPEHESQHAVFLMSGGPAVADGPLEGAELYACLRKVLTTADRCTSAT